MERWSPLGALGLVGLTENLKDHKRLRPSFVSPRRKEGPPCIWDAHGISGNVSANSHASSSAPYPQELNPWETTIEEPLHMSTAEKSGIPERDPRSEMPVRTVSQRFSHLQWRRLFKELWSRPNNDLQISDLHFDKLPTPATFACWKIRFKTEVCYLFTILLPEAMQWIKEVELVDSVDELRSSSSIRSIPMPDFEVLDARIASALKIITIIPSSKGESVWRNKRPRSRTVYLIYDHFRVTGSHDSVENYTDLFTIVLRNDDIQEFDSKWDGILIVYDENPT